MCFFVIRCCCCCCYFCYASSNYFFRVVIFVRLFHLDWWNGWNCAISHLILHGFSFNHHSPRLVRYSVQNRNYNSIFDGWWENKSLNSNGYFKSIKLLETKWSFRLYSSARWTLNTHTHTLTHDKKIVEMEFNVQLWYKFTSHGERKFF